MVVLGLCSPCYPAVMFIRKKKSSLTSKVAIQIVESERVGKRVRQKIIQHVGSSEHPEDLKRLVSVTEEIMIRLKQERIPPSPLFGPEKFIQYRNKNNEDFADVGLKQLREKHRFNRGIADVFSFAEAYTPLVATPKQKNNMPYHFLSHL